MANEMVLHSKRHHDMGLHTEGEKSHLPHHTLENSFLTCVACSAHKEQHPVHTSLRPQCPPLNSKKEGDGGSLSYF